MYWRLIVNKESKESFIEKNLWWLLLIIGLISLSVYFWQFHGTLSNKSDKWDHFGGYIGGIFSGMAFLALIAEMRANKKDKKIQEKRYQYQIQNLKEQKEEQDKRWKKESFERTFFMMLEQFNRKLNSLDDKENIADIYSIILRNKDFIITRSNLENGENRSTYSNLNQLFINLYRILKFINNFKELNDEEKRTYSSLLRSYLSREYLVILGFHLCYRQNNIQYRSFIKLIEKYNFFEHIGLSVLEIEFWSRYIPKYKEYFDDKNNEGLHRIYSHIISNKEIKIDMEEEVKLQLNRAEGIKHILEDIIDCRINGKELKNKKPKLKYEVYIQSIFLHLLVNFNKSFENNIEYEDIQVCYKQFTDNLKEFYPEYNIQI